MTILFSSNSFAEEIMFLGRSNQGRLQSVLTKLSIEDVRKVKSEDECNERCSISLYDAEKLLGKDVLSQSFYVSNFKGNVVEKVQFKSFELVLNQLTLKFRLFGTLDYKIKDKVFEQDYLISSKELNHKRTFPRMAYRNVKPTKLKKFSGFPDNFQLYSFINKDKAGKDLLFTSNRFFKAIYKVDKENKKLTPFLDPEHGSSLELVSYDKENAELTLKRVGFQFREYVIYDLNNDTFKIVR